MLKTLLILLVCFVLTACEANFQNNNQRIAISEAQVIFKKQLAVGVDMSKGPCLSNELIPDWVLDVSHDPRQPVDDLPENQCSAYIEGKAHHFVELDENGNLLKVF